MGHALALPVNCSKSAISGLQKGSRRGTHEIVTSCGLLQREGFGFADDGKIDTIVRVTGRVTFAWPN